MLRDLAYRWLLRRIVRQIKVEQVFLLTYRLHSQGQSTIKFIFEPRPVKSGSRHPYSHIERTSCFALRSNS